MKQIAKLKDEARKFEQREEWEKAIQAYIEVLRLAEQGDGSDMDLPLYNRVGDLYVRLGRSAEAVKYYEQAADKYAETGLYNNAIALCNKALRYDAGRVELLKKLGQFSASQGFFTDARRWYLEYCERMSKRGAIDQAFVALKELADLHDNPEIRELLARQLRDHGHTEQALEEFRRAYALRIAAGQTGEAQELRSEILALDPNANLEQGAATAAPHEPGPAAGSRNDLPGFIDFETASSQPVAFDGPSQPSTIEQEPLDIESPIPDYAAAESAPDIGAIDIEQPMVSGPPDLGEMERIDLGIESTAEFTPPAPGELETEQITDTFDLPTFDLNEIGTDLSGGFNLGLNDVQAEPAAAEAEAEAEEDVEPLPGFDEFDAPMSGTADDLPLMEVPDDSFRFSFDDEPDIP
ncbi:MAG TPA: tetratricopeptide repeat protein, partial [Steroidobacteraceae bacterium]